MFKKKRKKYLRSSHVDGKRKIACFHVETVTGNREKWRENRGHVVIFAVRVSRIPDARHLAPRFSFLRLTWNCGLTSGVCG